MGMLQRAQERLRGTDVTQWNLPLPNGQALGLENIPMGWSAMGDAVHMEVDLTGSMEHKAEFDSVEKFFLKSARPGVVVVSVTRIQNLLLWHLYAHARKGVAAKKLNNGYPNEEYLWHGAGSSAVSDATEKIICSGFDAAYSRCNPKGIWLSTNSAYSAAGYSPPCPDGTKKMFLVRCVLGYIGTQSNFVQNMVNGELTDSHHCWPSGSGPGTSVGHTRKDDQTGGRDNRYVINRNNQVYPAYLVKFRG